MSSVNVNPYNAITSLGLISSSFPRDTIPAVSIAAIMWSSFISLPPIFGVIVDFNEIISAMKILADFSPRINNYKHKIDQLYGMYLTI